MKKGTKLGTENLEKTQNGGQKNDAKNDLEKVTRANPSRWRSRVGGLARH